MRNHQAHKLKIESGVQSMSINKILSNNENLFQDQASSDWMKISANFRLIYDF